MKKRMLVFGGEMFVSMNYNSENYEIKKNNVLNKLNEKFDLINFSNNKLTSSKALLYAKTFLNKNEYDECLVQLGQADSKLLSSEDFKNNLESLVDLLFNHGIKPVFVSISKDSQTEEYQNIVDTTAKKYDLSLISFSNDDDPSYLVKTEAQFKRAIMNICL